MNLLIVLGICAAVRVWLICNTCVIAKDGTIYVRMAREWSSDPARVVRNYDYHVGYPAAMDGAHRLLRALGWNETLRTWELSGQFVSLIAGLSATAAVWMFAGMTFDWRTAWIAALLFGIGRKWSVLGADVLSDALGLSLQMWAVVLSVAVLRRLTRRSSWCIALAGCVGICSGAGYLVRPEALVPAALGGMLWVGYQIRRKGSWRLTLGALGANAAAVLACALPYAIAIGELTKKKSITDFVTAPLAPEGAQTLLPFVAAGQYGAVRHFVNQLFEALHPVVGLLVCFYLGICVVKRFAASRNRDFPLPVPIPRSDGLFMILSGMAVMAPLLMGLYVNVGYLSYRHVMFLAMLLSPLAGAGVCVLAESGTLIVRRFAHRNTARSPVLAIITIAMLLGMGSHTLRPAHAGKGYYHQAAQFIARSAQPDDYVLTDSVWILHYSRVPGIQLRTREMKREAFIAAAQTRRATYLVISDETVRKGGPELQDTLSGPQFTEIARFVQKRPENPDTLRVYRLTRG